MKKGILVAFLAIGFIFAGVLSASAATWQLVQDAAYAYRAVGGDNRLCNANDVTNAGSSPCNMDPQVDCRGLSGPAATPSTGTCSYAQLNFTMASSCAAGPTGQSCTTNTDCGSTITPCVPCSPNPGITYFGQHSVGGSLSAGTFTTKSCENSGDVTAVAIGTSEVVSNVGGSCLVTGTPAGSTGCAPAAGTEAITMNLNLRTNSVLANCLTPAGSMPGLALSGQIMSAASPVSACSYTTGEIASIVTTAGLGGQYLSIMCGSGTLPSDLATVCIRSAPWQATIVAATSTDVTATCPAACPTGCTGAAAEGIE